MDNVLKGYVVGYRSMVSALLNRIRELEPHEYPTQLSKQLLRTLKGAIVASEKEVDELLRDGGPGAANSIIRHGQLLTWIHQQVHLVSTSVGSDVPRWAIQPMKYEIGKFLQDSVDIIMVGSHEGGNFAYDWRLDQLRPFLAQVFGPDKGTSLASDLPQHMAVFHFPFGERDNVIAHGAFFHEVGHQIDIGITGISERVVGSFVGSTEPALRKEVSRQLRKTFVGSGEHAQTTFDDQQLELMSEEVVKAVQAVLYRWGREFCADLIATRILGPAYAIVAVVSPTLLSTFEIHSPSHPATALRLKTILSLLADSRSGDFFTHSRGALEKAGILDILEGWRARCAAADAAKFRWHQAAHMFAPEMNSYIGSISDGLADAVKSAVIAETKDLRYYTPTGLNEDVDQVLPQLQQWITINERIDYASRTHRPNEIASIFNVGLARYLSEDSAELRERLNHLLRKSIELSQIQRVLLSQE